MSKWGKGLGGETAPATQNPCRNPRAWRMNPSSANPRVYLDPCGCPGVCLVFWMKYARQTNMNGPTVIFAHARWWRISKKQFIYIMLVIQLSNQWATFREVCRNSGLGQWPVRNWRPVHGQGERATSKVQDTNNLSDSARTQDCRRTLHIRRRQAVLKAICGSLQYHQIKLPTYGLPTRRWQLAMIVETLVNGQHSTWLTPERQSHTLNSAAKNPTSIQTFLRDIADKRTTRIPQNKFVHLPSSLSGSIPSVKFHLPHLLHVSELGRWYSKFNFVLRMCP